MLKVAVVALFLITIAVLSYLVFISFKLLQKAEKERKAELGQKPSKSKLHPKVKDQNQP